MPESSSVRTELQTRPVQTRPYEATAITTIVGAVLRAMGATLKNLFRKPVTVHYPDVTRKYPDRYRGLLALVYDKETGQLLRVFARASRAIEENPSAVYQKVSARADVPRQELERFRELLRLP